MSRGVDPLDPFEAFLAEFRHLPDGELLRAWRAEAGRKDDAADGRHPRVRRQALLTVVGERFGVAGPPGIPRGRGDPSAGAGQAALAEGHEVFVRPSPPPG